MPSLVSLPSEILLHILTHAAQQRGLKRATRLRLVCKHLATITTIAIFDSGLLDHNSNSFYVQKAPSFWGEYLAYRTLHTTRPKTVHTRTLLRLAQRICRHRHAVTNADYTDDELKECLVEICKLPPLSLSFEQGIEEWLVPSSKNDAEIDVEESEADLPFEGQLLSAAAWLGERSLVEKLLQKGCNHHDYYGMLLPPLRAASYCGHTEIVKLLMGDESGDPEPLRSRPYSIINFAMANDHIELLDLALDPVFHKGELLEDEVLNLKRDAASKTRRVETFSKLLAELKPTILKYEMRWLPDQLANAAADGKTDIVRFLLQSEHAPIDGNPRDADRSMFASFNPDQDKVELQKGYLLRDRYDRPLSRAARNGHTDTVKVLLDSGAQHDHALEAAVAGGRREIAKTLWEKGGNPDDAVQGAFVMAMEREDTGMIDVLKECGAKMEEAVRVAAREIVEKEGLDSMVKSLDEY